MASGQTPQERLPDRSGEPAGTVADGTTESVSSVLEPGNEPAKAQLPRPRPARSATPPLVPSLPRPPARA